MAKGMTQLVRDRAFCGRFCVAAGLMACCVAGSVSLAGCGSERAAPPEHFASPVQQDMHGLKGDDMPPTQGAPMPAGWKGFKPY